MALTPEELEELEYLELEAKARGSKKQAAPKREAESGIEDFFEGVGASALETYTGIKDLAGAATEKDYARLRDWKEDAAQSGWGRAGEITGDIGQFFVPGGAAVKGLKLASKANKLARATQASRASRAATRAVADTTGAAGLGYVKMPGEGETRAENAAMEGLSAVAGEGAGYLLGKGLRGINKTDAGQKLLDAGVNVTPGRAAKNKFFSASESIAEVTPFLGRGVKAAQRRANEEFADVVRQEAAPRGFKVTKDGFEGIRQLKGAFDDAYSDAWSGATSVGEDTIFGINQIINDSAPKLTKRQKRALSSIKDDVDSLAGSGASPDTLKALDNDLRRRINAAKKDYDYQGVLKDMRARLRAGMPNNVVDKLSAVDEQYGKFLVARRAAKNASKDGGNFDSNQLDSAMKAIGKEQAGEGTAPLQDLSSAASQSIGQKVGGQPLEWWRRVVDISPTPLPLRATGKTLLGETKLQKSLSRASDKVPEYLARPGAYAAAIRSKREEEEEY